MARRGERELTVRLPGQLLESIVKLRVDVLVAQGERLTRERLVADALAALPKDDAKVLSQVRQAPRADSGLQKVALTLPAELVTRAERLALSSELRVNGEARVTATAILISALEQYLPKVRKRYGV